MKLLWLWKVTFMLHEENSGFLFVVLILQSLCLKASPSSFPDRSPFLIKEKIQLLEQRYFLLSSFFFNWSGRISTVYLTFVLKDYTVFPYTELSLSAFLPLDGWLVKGIPLDVYKHV